MYHKVEELITIAKKKITKKVSELRKGKEFEVVCEVVDYPKQNVLHSDKLKVIVCQTGIRSTMVDYGSTDILFTFVGNLETGDVHEIRRLSEFK